MASSTAGTQQTHGPHGRLRAIRLDPLEDIGLPSKGDNRYFYASLDAFALLDFKTQEKYYGNIQERYAQLNSLSDGAEGIHTAFASLALDEHEKTEPDDHSVRTKQRYPQCLEHSKELSIILEAMRKVREGIVASHRVDDFALQVYMFVIRTTILLKHMPSYHPALLYLLHSLHPVNPLATLERDEIIGYYILDLACRQNDLAFAYEVRHQYKHRSRVVGLTLRALVHGEWLMFWKLKASMNVYQQRLMDSADGRIQIIALKALGKSYLKIQLTYLECALKCSWDELTEQDKVGWTLQGQTIVKRRSQNK
ncbi:MAG: hypothetical protein Q9195_004419 [Heterodermia aff. obscurata]